MKKLCSFIFKPPSSTHNWLRIHGFEACVQQHIPPSQWIFSICTSHLAPHPPFFKTSRHNIFPHSPVPLAAQCVSSKSHKHTNIHTHTRAHTERDRGREREPEHYRLRIGFYFIWFSSFSYLLLHFNAHSVVIATQNMASVSVCHCFSAVAVTAWFSLFLNQ